MEKDVKTFIAGGLAGCAAKTVIAPLDRVKILFQTSNPSYLKYSGSLLGAFGAMQQIYQQTGVTGLFQGHSATLARIFPYAAIKFMSYERFKQVLMPTKDFESAWRRGLAGSLAGVTSVFFSYPLELIRVRLAFLVRTADSPISIIDTFRHIYQEQNPFIKTRFISRIANFYRGFFPTVYGMIPYSGVSFLVYETLKEQCLHNPLLLSEPNKLKVWAFLGCGAISGAMAQTASYPFEVVRRNMQVAGLIGNKAAATTIDTFKYIYTTKGVRGFFVGLSIGYIKVTPMFAVSFFTYEWLKIALKI